MLLDNNDWLNLIKPLWLAAEVLGDIWWKTGQGINSILTAGLTDVASLRLGLMAYPLLMALIFGQTLFLAAGLYHDLKVIGMLHIASVSAANFNWLTAVVKKMTRFLAPINRGSWLVVTILAYLNLVPDSAAVWRAGIMVLVVAVAGDWWHRPRQLGLILIEVGGGLILWRREWLTSLSWQLSMAAVGGLIWLQPRINNWGSRPTYLVDDQSAGRPQSPFLIWLKSNLSQSVAVNLMIAPILLANFSVFNLAGVLANLILGEAVGWLTNLSFGWWLGWLVVKILAILGLNWLKILWPMEFIFDQLAYFFTNLVHFLAEWLVIDLIWPNWSIYHSIVYYGGLILVIFLSNQVEKRMKHQSEFCLNV